jgi:methyl-accepting chemotaxis protein
MIEFSLDGTILSANENFLKTMGYTLGEIIGKHHAIFMSPADRESADYREFWADLRRGVSRRGEFKRFARDGSEIWLQASYSPVLAPDGRPVKVVKLAADVTREKLRGTDYIGQIEAIRRSQAVIEFNLDGAVITANEGFQQTMGYGLAEIQDRHHSMFVPPETRNSPEYRDFWAALGRGEYRSGDFKRVAKDGRDVWLHATYNPILSPDGKPFKVVKFATDITQEKLRAADFAGQIAAIHRTQVVIEFAVDGTIQTANAAFLNAVGYTLGEIQARHHAMFVDPATRNSAEYQSFWASLGRGEVKTGEFKRMAKDGHEIWLRASYNPILDLDGKPCKVVKFATDITLQVAARHGFDTVIDSVAGGIQQMDGAVREIAETMVKSQETATGATHSVGQADEAAHRLEAAARSMGRIVEMIGKITAQINLLALNASIESARAGEAGRGFAVVANEVKELAKRAKEATDEISTEIGGLRDVAHDVVDALAVIKHSFGAVREYVTSTASAVEEQSAATQEIARHMRDAADQATRLWAA